MKSVSSFTPFLILLAGAITSHDASAQMPLPAQFKQPSAEIPFEKRLLEIAGEYQKWGKPDDSLRWAPTACAPARPTPPKVVPKFSKSDDDAPHGRKLYLLFASDSLAYATLSTADVQPPFKNAPNAAPPPPPLQNFAIVKESWLPREVPGIVAVDQGKPVLLPEKTAGNANPRSIDLTTLTARDGKWYQPGEKGPLFVMYRVDPKTPGTDDGWVYGTLEPDGKKVTSAGLVKSCMECHQQAPHGRLFGLPPAKQP